MDGAQVDAREARWRGHGGTGRAAAAVGAAYVVAGDDRHGSGLDLSR